MVALALTRLFNGGTQPLIPAELGWGNGVIMPGESFETEHPETYGPPWVQDPEAVAAVQKAQEELSSAETADGHTGPRDGPEETLHTLSNGDVVNETGQVVGHLSDSVGHLDAAIPPPNQEEQP